MIHTSQLLIYRLPRMTELVLLFLLAWLITGLWQGVPQQEKPTTDNGNMRTLQLPDLTSLTKVALFGKMQSKKTAERENTPVINSPLHIQLLGVVQADEHSAAIIKHEGKQHVYFVGERIQPGVTLHAVDADAIIIRRNGVLEKVSMQKIQSPISANPDRAMKTGMP